VEHGQTKLLASEIRSINSVILELSNRNLSENHAAGATGLPHWQGSFNESSQNPSAFDEQRKRWRRGLVPSKNVGASKGNVANRKELTASSQEVA
jgi:hypothetical protein